ncbi:hypothetical protein PUNSTDRAFT_140422 [Punctularia strigosozonata HHB-11173 SS5]|uniref:uncharacterized protein n=1 Tax=Punctularia strigosozonata (strain HHB-11173) TaxID=741275 RepID=UPI0004416E3E|nr:uncharacterized protein PUNSTDRAFT_140422 [Punctularia strigosozonata HHB-11173 SS5]EIN14030.1 hypothetical protein PUNSTDRAFT_140422 [Punctularia strigosozonata HHB-11173 SS5]
MVSALWQASAEGNLELVSDLLKDASSADIEIKDHDGVTPLIEAVKNGHVEVVRALLDRGADPNNASNHGPPEQYTQDPAILELIRAAQSRLDQNGAHAQGYGEPLMEPPKDYYAPPPGAYYYPGYAGGPPPPLPEGTMPYYPPPPNEPQYGNVPPPNVARMIPCRFYPACRYGSSCLFAHPQGPYYGPPAGQYPVPYDPMAPPPFPQSYYPISPPFQSPNGVPPQIDGNGQHPTPPPPHARSGSDIVSPIQTHFPPMPPPGPYSAVSPVAAPFAAPMPVPMGVPLPHSPSAGPVPNSQYPHPPGATPFPVQTSIGHPHDGARIEANGIHSPPPHQPQLDGYAPTPHGRDTVSQHRRGSMRRPSLVGRKPPCVFFPSGRCRNGDDCRFPHVISDGNNAHGAPAYGHRGGHRPRYSSHVNGLATIDQKMANMSLGDHNGHGPAATDGINRSISADNGARGRQQPNFRHPGPAAGPNRTDKRPYAKQRVPGADEFPTLAGTAPSPSRSPGMHALPERTAAQVLQAPAPVRKDSFRDAASNGSVNGSSDTSSVKEIKSAAPEPPSSSTPSVHSPEAPPAQKLPVSFAAVANGTAPQSAAPQLPDAAKEVSVTA